MRETKYASIGKAVLIQMVGLQENYKDSEQLDRKKSGCFTCPHFGVSLKNPGCAACAACTSKSFSSRYINEKNRYGYQPPQTLCGMKLFLYLHFCSVTKAGAIADIYIPTLSDKLGISQRNIHYCLQRLENDGYLVYGRNDGGPGHYAVFLRCYEDYFKNANEGGRGYVTLSLECMDELCNVSSINQMRLYIRMYINIDDRKSLPFSIETFLTDSRSVKDLSRYFPSYFKQGKVINLLKRDTSLFSFCENSGQVSYTLNKDFYGDLQKRDYHDSCLISIQSYIQETNNDLKGYMDYNVSAIALPKELIQQAIKARGSGKPLFIGMEDNEAEDLASIATQYGYDIILEAIKILWAENPLPSLKGHYGEYIRHILENRLRAA